MEIEDRGSSPSFITLEWEFLRNFVLLRVQTHLVVIPGRLCMRLTSGANAAPHVFLTAPS